MKKKIKMLLSKLRESKFFKIFFSTFLIFGVLLSCVVVPSSAAVLGSTITAGMYAIDLTLSSSSVHDVDLSGYFPFRSSHIDFDYLHISSDSYGWFEISYGDSNVSPSNPFYDLYVYDSANGFSNNYIRYGFIWVDQDVIVSTEFRELFYSIFYKVRGPDLQFYDIAYLYGSDAGYNFGYDEGFQDGHLASSELSYDQGFQDGVNSVDSSNLGQNIIGDTLSAPFRALDQFVIFKSPNGSEISLGYVFGGFISLTLLLAFLRFFAGG